MQCFITRTGSYLPGPPVDNDSIERFLGSIPEEANVKRSVLAMNGIDSRHYAQNTNQEPTENVYDMATKAILRCVRSQPLDRLIDINNRSSLDEQTHSRTRPFTMLVGGTTFAPYSGPGLSSIVHAQLAIDPVLRYPVEISSHSGICTSAAAALIAGIRAVRVGEHQSVVAYGSEHSSEVLKSRAINLIDDRNQHAELRQSQWFMSVFLRFMLSDGAGAFLLEAEPTPGHLSLKVDWVHSRSMAHSAPLCMRLDNSNRLLSQDVRVLNRYLFATAEPFAMEAFDLHVETLASYTMVLPHLSSFFFKRKMERLLEKLSKNRKKPIPYWTNLATAGNTGAASIFVMLDEFLKRHPIHSGDRLLLFIPESGQFNFVLISLTAVMHEP